MFRKVILSQIRFQRLKDTSALVYKVTNKILE